MVGNRIERKWIGKTGDDEVDDDDGPNFGSVGDDDACLLQQEERTGSSGEEMS